MNTPIASKLHRSTSTLFAGIALLTTGMLFFVIAGNIRTVPKSGGGGSYGGSPSFNTYNNNSYNGSFGNSDGSCSSTGPSATIIMVPVIKSLFDIATVPDTKIQELLKKRNDTIAAFDKPPESSTQPITEEQKYETPPTCYSLHPRTAARQIFEMYTRLNSLLIPVIHSENDIIIKKIYMPQWGHSLFTEFYFGIGAQQMPKVKMFGFSSEVGLNTSMRLKKNVGIRENISFLNSTSTNIGMDFEWDVINGDGTTDTVRKITSEYTAHALQLITEIWLGLPPSRMGEFYAFLGVGAVLMHETTRGYLGDANDLVTMATFAPISTSMDDWSPVFSTGYGYNSRLRICGFIFGCEMRYKLLIARNKRDIPSLSDNAPLSYYVTFGIRMIK